MLLEAPLAFVQSTAIITSSMLCEIDRKLLIQGLT